MDDGHRSDTIMESNLSRNFIRRIWDFLAHRNDTRKKKLTFSFLSPKASMLVTGLREWV